LERQTRLERVSSETHPFPGSPGKSLRAAKNLGVNSIGGEMLPDFSTPAFAFVALSTLHFRAVEDGGGPGPYRSDYRCQLRYVDDPVGVTNAEVRVYFVSREKVNTSEDVSALLAFSDWERQLERCREGSAFELREGGRVTATGVVHAIATRGARI
jgi:hypothetical protein